MIEFRDDLVVVLRTERAGRRVRRQEVLPVVLVVMEGGTVAARGVETSSC